MNSDSDKEIFCDDSTPYDSKNEDSSDPEPEDSYILDLEFESEEEVSVNKKLNIGNENFVVGLRIKFFQFFL